jgi:hypothetical protein
VLAIVALAPTVIAGVGGFFKPAFTIVALSILIPCLFIHIWIGVRKPARRRRRAKNGSGAVDLDALDDEIAPYFRDIPIGKALLYADSINNPANLRGRVSEYIEPLNRVVRQKVAITIEMPDTGGHELWFPLMTPVKGDLQDDLKITLDGDNVPTLTYREYLLVTIGVLTSLVAQAQASLDSEPFSAKERKANKKVLLQAAKTGANLIALRARLDESGKEGMLKCTKELDRLANLLDSGSNPRLALTAAAGMIRTLAGHYAILTVLPQCNEDYKRHVIEYEMYRIPSLKFARFWKVPMWLKDWTGALLGTRPIYLELDLNNAATAKSYHLMVLGPEGTYAAVQSMPNIDNSLKQGDGGREKLDHPYQRLQRRRGQRYFHVYMRAIPETIADRLRLSVKFYEVPPGSAATATAAALAAFLLIFLAGRITGPDYTALTGYSALVLSFPAAAAALAGFESRSTSMVNGTLASRASSVLTIALALCASGLMMAQAAHRLRRPVDHIAFGIHDRLWQFLVMIALLNVLYASYVWVTRTAYFYWLADRREDQRGAIMEKRS